MKEIKIQKLSMSNFKGCGALTLELGGKNAAIYGDNATGKTTVYDALTWLLFGKDSRGSSDQETIKPLDADGNVKDHNAVTTVEAVMTVGVDTDSSASLRSAQNDNGTHCTPLQITIRKEMQESWVTRRGSSASVYDGNEFRYFWDGVPCKKNEYTRRVGELVDEDVFRMLTSVTAFAFDMPWRKRREILYELSGVQTMSDRALLQEAAKGATDGGQIDRATGDAFEHLADQIGGGMTLDELKRVLLARRKGLLQTRDQTPARIDELNKQLTGLQVIDFEAAQLQLQEARAKGRMARAELAAGKSYSPELQARLDALRAQEDDLRREKAKEDAASQEEIGHAVLEMERLSKDNRDAIIRHLDDRRRLADELQDLERKNDAFRREQAQKLPDLRNLETDVDHLKQELLYLNGQVDRLQKDADNYAGTIEQDRAEWLRVNKEAFSGGTCPTCGQELPMQMMQEARERFEQDKAQRLERIQGQAAQHKESADRSQNEANQLRLQVAKTSEALEKAQKALEEARSVPTEIRDMDGYQENKTALEANLKALYATDGSLPDYSSRLQEIQGRIGELKNRKPSDDLQKRLDAHAAEMADVNRERAMADSERERRISAFKTDVYNAEAAEEAASGILAKKEMLATLFGRIDELTEGQRRASAELEEIDRDIFAMESFIRWKTHFIEDSINGLFKLVTFRLFREQANGGLEERCDVVVGGVPYLALNNGARINAGLDIIRRLAEHYCVRVPLFVDNAESVTRLEDAGTQVIRLVVSEQDDALRVEVCGDR